MEDMDKRRKYVYSVVNLELRTGKRRKEKNSGV